MKRRIEKFVVWLTLGWVFVSPIVLAFIVGTTTWFTNGVNAFTFSFRVWLGGIFIIWIISLIFRMWTPFFMIIGMAMFANWRINHEMEKYRKERKVLDKK